MSRRRVPRRKPAEKLLRNTIDRPGNLRLLRAASVKLRRVPLRRLQVVPVLTALRSRMPDRALAPLRSRALLRRRLVTRTVKAIRVIKATKVIRVIRVIKALKVIKVIKAVAPGISP
jgi:hypothetical protein